MYRPSKIIAAYKSGKSMQEVAETFNTTLNKVNRILRKHNIKRRSHSEAAKLAISKGRLKINAHTVSKHSKHLNADKAYILGVMCGDGWTYCKPKHTYQIALQATDKDFVDEFARCLKNVYGIHPKRSLISITTKNWSDKYQARLCCKAAHNDLLKYTSFKTNKWGVPQEIKNSNKNIQSAFIRGFFDSEGNVDTKSRKLGVTSVNLFGLQNIQDLLKSSSISSAIYSRRSRGNRAATYYLQIHGRQNIEKFSNKIGFAIARKQRLLDKLISNYVLHVTPHKKAVKQRQSILNFRASGLSYNQIAKKTDLSIGTVWNYCNT